MGFGTKRHSTPERSRSAGVHRSAFLAGRTGPWPVTALNRLPRSGVRRSGLSRRAGRGPPDRNRLPAAGERGGLAGRAVRRASTQVSTQASTQDWAQASPHIGRLRTGAARRAHSHQWRQPARSKAASAPAEPRQRARSSSATARRLDCKAFQNSWPVPPNATQVSGPAPWGQGLSGSGSCGPGVSAGATLFRRRPVAARHRRCAAIPNRRRPGHGRAWSRGNAARPAPLIRRLRDRRGKGGRRRWWSGLERAGQAFTPPPAPWPPVRRSCLR